ncbi:nicotinate-nucleotide adenylyltransferase [Alkalibacterium subtropicum]|uniref:Probable nicotinate-nucleotide adenylyltransferase n=1 Tax=Alkalibacterium subtropicum TaxID=753702 RepID=A0A1I1ECL0_9LACT|nr:nicotinate-nucleotide adenylyltransferase [Alkalibacterium subtropicum]SFB84486.1 nicotinate-nucleotide adenylyltransferase [Alkalibacterium subtropicum]
MVDKVANVIEPEVLTELFGASPKRKIGILGGTFNPPHLGHLIIAEQVRDQLDLEKILFMPSAEPPHKKVKKTIDGTYRSAMLTETLKGNDTFSIEDAELKRGGKSYTYDTIVELKQKNPEVDYYFIIGADMVQDLKNWYKIDELIKLVQFVAVNRPYYNLDTSYPVIGVDVPNIDISSTLIRQKVKHGCSIRYLVPPAVENYIESKGLYKNEENSDGIPE